MTINGETQIIGFFGSTYKTSKMYAMYNAAFEALQLNYIYIPFAVDNLQKAVEGIRNLGVKGIGITIPYKIEIMPYLDELDEDAKRIGAVNVVMNTNGKLIGGNTDGKGAVMALKETTEIRNKKVIILGAGGAARAIAFTIADEGGKVMLLSRTIDAANELAEKVGCESGSLEVLEEKLKSADIVINCTPVGMSPNENESLVKPEWLNSQVIVQELITKPKETTLIKGAQIKGCKIVYGDRMLFWQGVLKFEYFTGVKAPQKVMEKALENL